jgi:hypothetical protein
MVSTPKKVAETQGPSVPGNTQAPEVAQFGLGNTADSLSSVQEGNTAFSISGILSDMFSKIKKMPEGLAIGIMNGITFITEALRYISNAPARLWALLTKKAESEEQVQARSQVQQGSDQRSSEGDLEVLRLQEEAARTELQVSLQEALARFAQVQLAQQEAKLAEAVKLAEATKLAEAGKVEFALQETRVRLAVIDEEGPARSELQASFEQGVAQAKLATEARLVAAAVDAAPAQDTTPTVASSETPAPQGQVQTAPAPAVSVLDID